MQGGGGVERKGNSQQILQSLILEFLLEILLIKIKLHKEWNMEQMEPTDQ